MRSTVKAAAAPVAARTTTADVEPDPVRPPIRAAVVSAASGAIAMAWP
jgi:hypothetical protein